MNGHFLRRLFHNLVYDTLAVLRGKKLSRRTWHTKSPPRISLESVLRRSFYHSGYNLLKNGLRFILIIFILLQVKRWLSGLLEILRAHTAAFHFVPQTINLFSTQRVERLSTTLNAVLGGVRSLIFYTITHS